MKSKSRCLLTVPVTAPIAALLTVLSAPVTASCDTAAHRQFDFWLGDWQVYKADGSIAGENRISRELNGCVLRERYQTSKGYQGESFNIYDASNQRWHQTWVDNGGLLLQLDGDRQGDSMVLEGDSRDGTGTLRRQRIRWTPNADGSVRQLWQAQAADGSWQTVFDGYYRRRVPTP